MEKCFNATELYAMAEEYQVKELSGRIQWHIVVEVTVENAAEMFKFGVLYNNEAIKGASFRDIETSLNKNLPRTLMTSVLPCYAIMTYSKIMAKRGFNVYFI